MGGYGLDGMIGKRMLIRAADIFFSFDIYV